MATPVAAAVCGGEAAAHADCNRAGPGSGSGSGSSQKVSAPTPGPNTDPACNPSPLSRGPTVPLQIPHHALALVPGVTPPSVPLLLTSATRTAQDDEVARVLADEGRQHRAQPRPPILSMGHSPDPPSSAQGTAPTPHAQHGAQPRPPVLSMGHSPDPPSSAWGTAPTPHPQHWSTAPTPHAQHWGTAPTPNP